MVLIIENRTYKEKCRFDDLRQHSDLIQRSTQFARSAEIRQPKNEIDRTIFVAQREFAVVNRNDPHGFHLIGTDDATTCHIFVLENQSAVALAHLDGCETRASIDSMIDEMKKISNETNFDVFIVGGFIEQSQKNHSLELSNEILEILSRMSNDTFHLRLAAMTNYNDQIVNTVHFPLVYGLCFDIRDKSMRKMNFVSFGPAFRLRMVYHSVSSHPCLCIYSSFKGEISLPNFRIEQNIVERYYRPLYSNYFHKDDQLLRLTSTSPKQERPSYLFNMKKTIVFILKFSTKISEFFDEKTNSIVFRWINGQWRTENPNFIDDIEL